MTTKATKFELLIGHNLRMGGSWPATEVQGCVIDTMKDFGINGYNIQRLQGVWDGELEESTCVTVIVDDYFVADQRSSIHDAACCLRSMLAQDCVLLTETDCEINYL